MLKAAFPRTDKGLAAAVIQEKEKSDETGNEAVMEKREERDFFFCDFLALFYIFPALKKGVPNRLHQTGFYARFPYNHTYFPRNGKQKKSSMLFI